MKLPKSWGEVTIEQYLKVHTIVKTIADPIERGIHIIAALSGSTFKEVEQLKVAQLNGYVAQLHFLSELPTERLPLQFKLGGKRYKALIFQHEMTAAQFIDYSSVCRQAQSPEDLVYQMHKLLGCFCIPGKRKFWLAPYTYIYDGYDKEAELFYKRMPMTIAYPFYIFFCNVWLSLLPPMEDYFRKEALANLIKPVPKKEIVN